MKRLVAVWFGALVMAGCCDEDKLGHLPQGNIGGTGGDGSGEGGGGGYHPPECWVEGPPLADLSPCCDDHDCPFAPGSCMQPSQLCLGAIIDEDTGAWVLGTCHDAYLPPGSDCGDGVGTCDAFGQCIAKPDGSTGGAGGAGGQGGAP